MTDIEENQDMLLVAEYTLGLMEPAEAEAFAKRLVKDAKLRDEYIRWTEHFATLADEIDEVAPPSKLKSDIESRLFGEPKPERAPKPSRGLFDWFNTRWAGAMAMLGVLGLMLFLNMPASFSPSYTAALVSEDNRLQVSALYDASKQVLRMESIQGKPAVGRDFELWVIVGDKAPVSLGVMASLDKREFIVPVTLAHDMTGATLALSDEPQGGSPTGSPTGAVLVAAKIEAI